MSVARIIIGRSALRAVLLATVMPGFALCLAQENTAKQPATPKQVFDSIVGSEEAAMTVDQAAEYLRAYDVRYSDPELRAYADRDPEFRRFQEERILRDARKLVADEGHDVNGKRRISRERFVQIAARKTPALKEDKGTDYLSAVTGGVLKTKNISISRSTTKQGDEKRPAQFALNHTKDGTFIGIDAAVAYKVGEFAPWHFANGYSAVPVFSVGAEAHTTTQAPSKREEDSLAFKTPFELHISPSTPRFGNSFALTPSYERNRKKTVETYGGSLLWSPSVGSSHEGLLALAQTGRFIPLSRIFTTLESDYPGILWRPWFGAELGERLMSDSADADASKAYGGDRGFARLVITGRFDVYLTRNFDIAIDVSHRKFLTGSELGFSYVEVSPTLFLDGAAQDEDTRFSVGFTYKNGKTTPQFKNVNSISAWLGVRY